METFLFLLGLIEKIPATFWGVVIGSFFSIAGVALTNWASDRRLRVQFAHEREQKTKDREMALRKEIYLAAAEAIAEGVNAIARFVNLELQNDQISGKYTENSPAIAKVQVIGKTKTVVALMTFTADLGATFLELFAKRFELISEKNQIRLIDDQIAEFGKERDRMLELIKQYNIDGTINEHRWQVLQKNFDFEQKRIKANIAQRDALAKSLYVKQIEFMQVCIAETNRFAKLIVPVISAVREELEFPFDEDSYLQVVQQVVSKQEIAVKAFVDKIRPNGTPPAVPNDSPQEEGARA